jgi:exodeoxyribonuclease V beta subunit
MLKGFLDLVVCYGDRYYVMDYKSNALGPDDQAYTEPAMRQAILEHRYDLQFSLYTLALHRLLQTRLSDYDYDRHMGGVVYFFLRGVDGPTQGCFVERLPKSLVESMDQMFSGALLL